MFKTSPIQQYVGTEHTICTGRQCFGSGYIFYGSGSWIFFPNPDPESRFRIQATKNKFFKGKTKILGEFFFSTQKVGILFLFSTNQVGILLNTEICGKSGFL